MVDRCVNHKKYTPSFTISKDFIEDPAFKNYYIEKQNSLGILCHESPVLL